MSTAEDNIVERIRAGDEQAFVGFVQRHHPAMIRVAIHHCRDPRVAEEVVQEAWAAVLKGLESFEGRSSLKTWVFRIVRNCAITRGRKERRSVPLSALGPEDEGPAVDPSRFAADGMWADPPLSWESEPDRRLSDAEIHRLVRGAIDELPERQRLVILLRDVQGLDSEDACEVLGISMGNQRVLLHRARSKVREQLESYYRGTST